MFLVSFIIFKFDCTFHFPSIAKFKNIKILNSECSALSYLLYGNLQYGTLKLSVLINQRVEKHYLPEQKMQ